MTYYGLKSLSVFVTVALYAPNCLCTHES